MKIMTFMPLAIKGAAHPQAGRNHLGLQGELSA
jgi:hypothetical protein